jgi:crossover junction endodeoxyribonuclease RuvC
MIILGIDPGIERTGYALLNQDKAGVSLITCGCIMTSKNDSTAQRLVEINSDLTEIIKKHKPEIMAVESLFFQNNAKTAITVGQARGVAVFTGQKLGLSILDITPLQVKIAATGYGKADKKQVQEMVVRLLKLKKIPKPDDAVDACAIAWAGLGRSKLANLK